MGTKVLQELEAKNPWKMVSKVLQLEAKSHWKMGIKVLQELEAKSPWKVGKRHTYELYECENEIVKFQTMSFDLCQI